MNKDIGRRNQSPEQEAETLQIVGGEQGVQIGNTDPSNRKVVLCGLDWLKIVAFGVNVPAAVRALLEEKKKEASEGAEVYVCLAERQWRVLANGTGKANNHFAYLLHIPGLTLAIQKRDASVQGGQPVAYLEAEGQFCSGRNPADLHSELLAVFKAAGVVANRVTVGRVDIAADVSGIHVNDVAKAEARGLIVARPQTYAPLRRGRNYETIEFGTKSSASCQLEVYDKLKELAKNEIKCENYKAAAGIEELPSSLTRFEFKYGGEYLREQHNIQSSAELIASLSGLVAYQMTSWIRICSHVDRKNTEHSKPVAWWEWLKGAMQKRLQGFKETKRRPVRPPMMKALRNQILGGLSSACALAGSMASTPAEAFEFIRHQLTVLDSSFEEACHRKADKFRRSMCVDVMAVDPMAF